MDVFWVNVWTSCKRFLEDFLATRRVPAGCISKHQCNVNMGRSVNSWLTLHIYFSVYHHGEFIVLQQGLLLFGIVQVRFTTNPIIIILRCLLTMIYVHCIINTKYLHWNFTDMISRFLCTDEICQYIMSVTVITSEIEAYLYAITVFGYFLW